MSESSIRRCRGCGCTDDNACVVDGYYETGTCRWVEADLCSGCSGEDKLIEGPLRGGGESDRISKASLWVAAA